MRYLAAILLLLGFSGRAYAQPVGWGQATILDMQNQPVDSGSLGEFGISALLNAPPQAKAQPLPMLRWIRSDADSTVLSGLAGVLLDGPTPSPLLQSRKSAPDAPFFVVSATAGEMDAADWYWERTDAQTPEALEALFAARSPGASDPARSLLALDASEPLQALSPGAVILPTDPVTDESWRQVVTFRARHPAIAAGAHELMQEVPYAFHRGLRLERSLRDDVIVVIGATGRVRLNVSRVFPNDAVLKDAVSGRIMMVSYGHVSATADESGLMLLETVE